MKLYKQIPVVESMANLCTQGESVFHLHNFNIVGFLHLLLFIVTIFVQLQLKG
jgi:hypothetical protein